MGGWEGGEREKREIEREREKRDREHVVKHVHYNCFLFPGHSTALLCQSFLRLQHPARDRDGREAAGPLYTTAGGRLS